MGEAVRAGAPTNDVLTVLTCPSSHPSPKSPSSGMQGTGTRGLSPEQSHVTPQHGEGRPFHSPSPSFHTLVSTAPTHHHRHLFCPFSPSCPLEMAPRPFHDTRQMARQTDGPFTQASRNRHGPARDEDMGTDGNTTRRGPAWSMSLHHQAWEGRRQPREHGSNRQEV